MHQPEGNNPQMPIGLKAVRRWKSPPCTWPFSLQ